MMKFANEMDEKNIIHDPKTTDTGRDDGKLYFWKQLLQWCVCRFFNDLSSALLYRRHYGPFWVSCVSETLLDLNLVCSSHFVEEVSHWNKNLT